MLETTTDQRSMVSVVYDEKAMVMNTKSQPPYAAITQVLMEEAKASGFYHETSIEEHFVTSDFLPLLIPSWQFFSFSNLRAYFVIWSKVINLKYLCG